MGGGVSRQTSVNENEEGGPPQFSVIERKGTQGQERKHHGNKGIEGLSVKKQGNR